MFLKLRSLMTARWTKMLSVKSGILSSNKTRKILQRVTGLLATKRPSPLFHKTKTTSKTMEITTIQLQRQNASNLSKSSDGLTYLRRISICRKVQLRKVSHRPSQALMKLRRLWSADRKQIRLSLAFAQPNPTFLSAATRWTTWVKTREVWSSQESQWLTRLV